MERDDLSDRLLSPYPQPATLAPPPASVAVGFVADLFAVGAFVVIGRHSHGEADSAGGILTTAWPFLVGVTGGYVPVVPLRWPVAAVRSGLMVVFKTVVLGMILRAAVQTGGTPFSFVVVAAVVLTALMLGWRRLAVRLPLFQLVPVGAPAPADAPSIL